MMLSSLQQLARYQDGRLKRLLEQERYRSQQEDLTVVCRDLLQQILMVKPDKPLLFMKEYFKELQDEKPLE